MCQGQYGPHTPLSSDTLAHGTRPFLRPDSRHEAKADQIWKGGATNLLNYRAYSGIGSRRTPPEICGLMTILGYHLAIDGWILRSGAAPGADTAFEMGAWNATCMEGVVKPEIYLPWAEFEGRKSSKVSRTAPQKEAYEISAPHHPAWNDLSDGVKSLHARNAHQVLGFDVTDPQLSSFVLCWTPDGKGEGGTGQALRLAKHYGVREIYDLGKDSDLKRVKDWLQSLAAHAE
jgi:hypothetical protein